jgi:formylmethanofuran dehydrogenase subunit D
MIKRRAGASRASRGENTGSTAGIRGRERPDEAVTSLPVSYIGGMAKPEVFILIPGRTSRQGTALNEGKFTPGYVEETSTLQMNADDMARLGLKSGDRVRLRSEQGQVELPCQAAKSGELPPGLLFLPYGDLSSRLMGGETHGTGMPNSKGIDVELERV